MVTTIPHKELLIQATHAYTASRRSRTTEIHRDTEPSNIDFLGRLALPRDLRIGNYSVGDMIAQGGMANVFEVYDRNRKLSALKIFHYPDQESTKWVNHRSISETVILNALDHPGIVKIKEIGTLLNTLYFVMDYIDGVTLDTLIQAPGYVVTPKQAIDYAYQIGLALEHTHSKGIVHRDVKPSNIIITPTGKAVLVDFSISTIEGEEPKFEKDLLVGSAGYMSVEQVKSNDIDYRSDIFSLFKVLYTCLDGTAPPHGSYLDLVFGFNPQNPSSLAEVPASWDALVLKGLHPNRDYRFSTTRGAVAALKRMKDSLENRLS